MEEAGQVKEAYVEATVVEEAKEDMEEKTDDKECMETDVMEYKRRRRPRQRL